MSAVIEFDVPLPPPALRSNNRAHWRVKMAAKQDYSEAVFWALMHTEPWGSTALDEMGLPWKAARVTYTWRHVGRAPDLSNLGANTKALQDILCMAPNNGLQTNNTTYLGLIEDDRGIEPVYRLKKVRHRTDELVRVTIERVLT